MNISSRMIKAMATLVIVFTPLISVAKIVSDNKVIYRESSGRGYAVEEFESGEGLWAARNDLEGVSASVYEGILEISFKGNGTYFVANSLDMSLDHSVSASKDFELTADVSRDFMIENNEALQRFASAPDLALEGVEFNPYGVYWGYRDDNNYQMVLIKGYLFSVGKVENGKWSGTDWMPALNERVDDKARKLYVDERARATMFSALAKAEMSVSQTYIRMAALATTFSESELVAGADSELLIKILDRLGYSKEERDFFFNVTWTHAARLWGGSNEIRVLQREGKLRIYLNDQELYSSSESTYIGELGRFGVLMQKSGHLTIDRFGVESWGEPADMQLAEVALQAGDFALALTHILPLAEEGDDAFAQARLGQMYVEGVGFTRDFEQGVSWLERSAGQGNESGQLTLGMVLATGPAEMQDFTAARSWLLKGLQGVTAQPTTHQRNAAYLLGTLFASGNGGPQDYQGARRWMELAGEPPEPLRMAVSALGEISLNGYDGNQDVEKARQLFLQAVNLGEPAAAINLCMIYGNGLGVTPDLVESYKWCWIGFQGSPPGPAKDYAKNLMAQLEGAMLPDQVKAAEYTAIEWMKAQLEGTQ